MIEEPNKKKQSVFKDFIAPVLIAVVIVFLLRHFVLGMYYIPSGSMIPTLNINNQVVVTKLSYRFHEPERGDIVVFKFPPTGEDYVKRLIGLPGDRINIKDNQLYVNDQALIEPYVAADTNMSDFGPITIPEGQYFMMGDNRNHSNDSRYWGTVERKFLIGKARVIYWPIKDWKVLS